MKRGLVLLLALLVLPGCSYLLPLANQPPRAYIDDISPARAEEGETVTFQGHGTDADGEVVAYRWRSTLDGQLSTLASFDTDDLSVGSHVIYLQVQDNNGAWSAEVRASIDVEAAPAAPARINSFTVTKSTIMEGESTTLSWNVSNATDVSLNQGIGEIASVGTTTVSPSQTTLYILRAEGGGAVATAQLTVSVEPAVLRIISFEADPEEAESGSKVTLSWETVGATGVRIDPYVGPVDESGTYNVYPTGETTHTFTLTATDGVEEVTADVEVETYIEGPATHEVTLEPVLDESGYVRSTGQSWDEFIYVGDDTNDISIQAFLSFDISDIPEDANIVSVVVDFSDHDSTYGDPFGGLGCLRAYADDYGTLTGSDFFSGTPTGAISRWCSMDQLEDPDEDDDYVDAIEDVLGEDRFQIRLQFNQHDTDDDGNNDLIRYTEQHLPRLIIEYTT